MQQQNTYKDMKPNNTTVFIVTQDAPAPSGVLDKSATPTIITRYVDAYLDDAETSQFKSIRLIKKSFTNGEDLMMAECHSGDFVLCLGLWNDGCSRQRTIEDDVDDKEFECWLESKNLVPIPNTSSYYIKQPISEGRIFPKSYIVTCIGLKKREVLMEEVAKKQFLNARVAKKYNEEMVAWARSSGYYYVNQTTWNRVDNLGNYTSLDLFFEFIKNTK